MPIYFIENLVKNYKWGSYSSIKDIFKKKNIDLNPEAEIWVGLCNGDYSNIIISNGKINISEVIQEDPSCILGKNVYDNFGANFPFLLKILAINNPLSIQVHPSVNQAINGFFDEHFIDKPCNKLLRNYNDLNKKIEFICAINPMWLLVGFREKEEIKIIIKDLFPNDSNFFIKSLLSNASNKKIIFFFLKMMSLKKEKIRRYIYSVIKKIRNIRYKSLIFEWILILYKLYPDDISIFSPIIMNTVFLHPGQAILIPENVAHVYMNGLGVEIMTNSDNIIRSGITNKFVNIDKFFSIIDLKKRTKLLSLKKFRSNEYSYNINISEFTISFIVLSKNTNYLANIRKNIEIILCTKGLATIIDICLGKKFNIKKGEILLITSSVFRYSITGVGTILKISVPAIDIF